MMILTGEVRKLIPDSYTDKDGRTHSRYLLVLEPDNKTQNYEIQFTVRQCEDLIHQQWEKLKGKKASVEVSLYVNYEHRFIKYSALTGQPIL